MPDLWGAELVRVRGQVDGQEVEVDVPPDLEDLFPPLSELSVSFRPEPPALCPVRKAITYMPMSVEAAEDAVLMRRTLAELMKRVLERG